MDEKLKTLKKTSLKYLKRKTFLDPLAIEFNINPTNFKNKQLLCDEINRLAFFKTFYNKTDPITLENIENIPPEFLVVWEQVNHTFAADIRSIKTLIQENQSILPWAIDFATGYQKAENNTDYNQKFDMKYNVELMKKLKDALAFSTTDETAPVQTKLRFHIENSTEHYISHVINFVEKCSNVPLFFYDSLNLASTHYQHEIKHEFSEEQINNFQVLEKLKYIIQRVQYDNNLELLVFLLHTIKLNTNSQSIIDLFFMTMIDILE